MKVQALKVKELYHSCDPSQFAFETTEDVEALEGFIGQPRAVEALRFGIGIQQAGFNMFAMGSAGIGRHTLVRELLERQAVREPIPQDICYVNNFDESHAPHILPLPAGRGRELAQDMTRLIDEIRNALRAAFENEDYQNRQQTIAQETQEKQQEAFEELQRKAKDEQLTALRTPAGLVFAPVRDGEVVPPDEFRQLPDEERQRVEAKVEKLQQEARRIMQKIPVWERAAREKQRRLNQEVTKFAIGPVIEELRQKYEGLERVQRFLETAENDIVENVRALLQPESGQQGQAPLQHVPAGDGGEAAAGIESQAQRRYRVHVLVDHSKSQGAPVVYEDNPTYHNLIGRVEHIAQMGALLTDFNMIRPGALHRANGGYLMIDAHKVLQHPFAWEGLKRALQLHQIKIDALGNMYSLISTVSLEPEAVPLKVKVVMIGSPLLYHLLRHYDSEFGKLFKVAADFEDRMNRSGEQQEAYVRLIATAARKAQLPPFDRGAVARLIEYSARLAGDGEKLSAHLQTITDLMREASYYADAQGNGTVEASEVQKAIDARDYRLDRLRQNMQEQIQRDIVMIDTEGSKVGQINGLAVIQLGDFAFGRPNRITARIRMGKGEVVDIEREVAMGGPIHSKGVLILSGFLGARYAIDQPLALSASLVFEQSYSGVEGDSASLAELYGLLSAIAEVPLAQSLAVTGSVNQHGQIQPIGGVNEKIEGFFDVCKTRTLKGDQGVLIPAANIKHLMLRRDVVEAVEADRFHIYPVTTIDEGIELLTGLEAGKPDEHGQYPPDSFNAKVNARLAAMARRRMEFMPALERGRKEA